MKAIWNNQILAEADKDELIFIEGNWYFPIDSVQMDLLTESDTPYTCPWKGECKYYDVHVGDSVNKDAVFQYPQPLPSAIERVKKDFSNHCAFWNGVVVSK